MTWLTVPTWVGPAFTPVATATATTTTTATAAITRAIVRTTFSTQCWPLSILLVEHWWCCPICANCIRRDEPSGSFCIQLATTGGSTSATTADAMPISDVTRHCRVRCIKSSINRSSIEHGHVEGLVDKVWRRRDKCGC